MTRPTKSLLARSLTGLCLATLTAAPALAEWVSRSTHGTDRSERGAQFVSPTIFTRDFAAATLSWGGRVEAPQLDFRTRTAPIDPQYIMHADCQTAAGSNPRPQMSCAHLTWNDAAFQFDFVIDLEDQKYAPNPIVDVTGLSLKKGESFAALLDASFSRTYGAFSYTGYVYVSCYADMASVARGLPQDCDTPPDRTERLAVVTAYVPVWIMKRAWTMLGGDASIKLSVDLERANGIDHHFAYAMTGLADVLFAE